MLYSILYTQSICIIIYCAYKKRIRKWSTAYGKRYKSTFYTAILYLICRVNQFIEIYIQYILYSTYIYFFFSFCLLIQQFVCLHLISTMFISLSFLFYFSTHPNPLILFPLLFRFLIMSLLNPFFLIYSSLSYISSLLLLWL